MYINNTNYSSKLFLTLNNRFEFLTVSSDVQIRYKIWRSCLYHKKGSVVLLGGRREFIEKYFETICNLTQKGFDVYILDWRGQGLSTRELTNPQKGFVKDYNDYIWDLKLFIDQIVIKDANLPLIILAHSMGGHIALRYLNEHNKKIDKAVLIAPMLDIETYPLPIFIARSITNFAIKAGLEKNYIIGAKDYSISSEKFKGNLLTSDPNRFMDEKNEIKKNPCLALGGVTYAWLKASFDSIDIISSPNYLSQINIPVLIVNAGNDKIVSKKAQKQAAKNLPQCRYVSIPESKHEILKEKDHIRELFWKEFDMFV